MYIQVQWTRQMLSSDPLLNGISSTTHLQQYKYLRISRQASIWQNDSFAHCRQWNLTWISTRMRTTPLPLPTVMALCLRRKEPPTTSGFVPILEYYAYQLQDRPISDSGCYVHLPSLWKTRPVCHIHMQSALASSAGVFVFRTIHHRPCRPNNQGLFQQAHNSPL